MKPFAYPDSSFLVSLVCRDVNTPAATAYMARAAAPLVFTPLHRIECRNALRNACARGALTATELRACFRQIEADLAEGLLVHTAFDQTSAFRRAEELSEKHAGKDGQRTIDLLHVAIALESGAKSFLSFDLRQRRLAKDAGLKVKP